MKCLAWIKQDEERRRKEKIRRKWEKEWEFFYYCDNQFLDSVKTLLDEDHSLINSKVKGKF